jgi:protocatechuate 3,4-dioxygenase beta subunit
MASTGLCAGLQVVGPSRAPAPSDRLCKHAIGNHRPRLRPRHDGPIDNDLTLNYAKPGRARSANGSSCMAASWTNGAPCAQHPGRILAGQCRRPLPAQEGHLSRPDRPEFRRLRTDLTGRDGYLLLPHRQARRLSLAQQRQRLAAGAHPCLGLRIQAFAQRLITQMYFEGDPLIPRCPIVRRSRPGRHRSAVARSST